MIVVQINATCGVGSTGKIVLSVSKALNEKGIENYILFSSKKSDYSQAIKFANRFEQCVSAVTSRIFGNNGFNSRVSTLRLIKHLKRIKPDIVHIHNIHANDVNISLLFRFLIREGVSVYYTFHDCWAFTGYCTFFTDIKCTKYTEKCGSCPVRKKASWFFDFSGHIQERKVHIFNSSNMKIITPSFWLSQCVKESRLSSLPVQVIHNGIDLDVFKPIEENDFRCKYNCSGKHIILGVAFGWGRRKGLDIFVSLSKKLPEDYQIVLIGTDENVDKSLPSNIISIHKTNNQNELAKVYSAADVFLNPTREDNFPTTNIEALACGTPVITFDTGGSPEAVTEKCGIVLKNTSIDDVLAAVINTCREHLFSSIDCIERARLFDEQTKFKEYVDLYLLEQTRKRGV